jgi:CheY-like chemotaxis protein
MNGRSLADAAMASAPGLKVLFTTGYTRDAIVTDGTLEAGVDLLPKPFTYKDLAEKIRQVLDA